ncbi:hypothetical protein [Tuwongella immobilis]|uniref:Cytochrome c domain-containing protein n=1 Tax=Tuwongella immobilis TaxID=692036 RepID=A0A6C2YRI5_9BACT|nr:hypothetical protein [Tuwongella immobilis]VIP03779.1 Uncharacterized protein OS=Pirellula staleyi (strain ATCC 27377 / DSM 6068 / ICPB 4128) GN=Psta_1962 PE=4 SV=1 [Tuwongella immobilis]VTS04926.1 Uncharacterized protein OS=Pirellula staleyi (strain ATCC 27377 / DSM 6068 / ICPB 4128) GN=Psta_1962 PE=4 SV=1 [Tuwongella immobilis]
MPRRFCLGTLILTLCLSANAWGQPFDPDLPPIRYWESTPENAVSRLMASLESGKQSLPFDPKHGYLPAILKRLSIPEASQVLVFSKTSLQQRQISPKTPRAIYFNDDTYVGWCLGGEVLEISTADPQLGAVFYSLSQDEVAKPKLIREYDRCALCHASRSNHQGVPSHLIRSVTTRGDGFPDLSLFRMVNHTTPIAKRWGGWYVTGYYRAREHMGNRLPRGGVSPGESVLDLSGLIRTSNYLQPTSDFIALMVLEHQAEGHNRLAKANMLTRSAIHDGEGIRKALELKEHEELGSTRVRIREACEPLVEYLFFCDEATLFGPFSEDTDFVQEFRNRGPKDRSGRSLREFDLDNRLFRYPLSYLVYSEAFAKLPPEAQTYVHRRMGEVLLGKDASPKFAHLTPELRLAIRQILIDTMPKLPKAWDTPEFRRANP